MQTNKLRSISKKLGLVGILLAFAGSIGEEILSVKNSHIGNSSGAEITIPLPQNYNRSLAKSNLPQDNQIKRQIAYLTEKANIYGAEHIRTKIFEDGRLKSYGIKTESTNTQGEKEYFIAFYDSQDNPLGYSTGNIIEGHMRPKEWKRFDTMSEFYDEEKAEAQGRKVIITKGLNLPISTLEEFHALRQRFEEAKK